LDDSHKTKLGKIIDECSDSLALFGHANGQVNMTRQELIKPQLRYEYLHLCAQTVPYTSWLFGDDISKTAKEIVDSQKFKRTSRKLKISNFSQIYSIKIYDFRTLYTAIPYDKLKTRLFNLIDS
jgi:hypothetical protein